MKHLRYTRAFTLIELLVVISIIGLLMAIVLPALSSAVKSAKSTVCMSNLRSVFQASVAYATDQDTFPPLNNDVNEGSWQYNYLLYDGTDYDSTWGPLVKPSSGLLADTQVFYCPLQTNDFHLYNSGTNPWPVVPGNDTRAGYGRRYGLSGESFDEEVKTIAFAADVFHFADVVRESHGDGVNAAYTDGHVTYVKERILLFNGLSKPFSPIDNPTVKDIWKRMDKVQ